MRLDLSIVHQFGYSRNKAQSIISSGLVSVNQQIITKSAYEVRDIDCITLSESPILSWVSRSAGKLQGFFDELGVSSLSGKSALDIGSSTGGFTQVLLEHSIDRVMAVDVGTNQLHPTLRSDTRVTLAENTDIRSFIPYQMYDIITIDVSFISLHEIVPILQRFTHSHTDIYMLYKPQFEVGRKNLRKTGVPKDDTIVKKKLSEFIEFLQLHSYRVQKLSKSCIIGEAGNQEYMMWLRADRE